MNSSLFFRCFALLLCVSTTLSALEPSYYPTTLKRVFASPPLKVVGTPLNKTLLAPIWNGLGSEIFDWGNIDYSVPYVKYNFPCGLGPNAVLNGKFVLSGDSLSKCRCTSPGDVACPPTLSVKIQGWSDYVDISIFDQAPSTTGFTFSLMKEDIIDGKGIYFKNNPPQDLTQGPNVTVNPDLWVACTEALNANEIAGNVAIIRMGNCNPVIQLRNAKAAGARAVLFIKPYGSGDGTINVLERILPGGAITWVNDNRYQIVASSVAGKEVLLRFGPRVGSLLPTLDTDGSKAPPGLVMSSLSDFKVLSMNTQIFLTTPPLWSVNNSLISLITDDISANQTLNYMSVSGAFNEKVQIYKSIDLTARGFFGSPLSTLEIRGRLYMITSNSTVALTQLYFWDISDSAHTTQLSQIILSGVSTSIAPFIYRPGSQVILGLSFYYPVSLATPQVWFYDITDPSDPQFVSMINETSLFTTRDRSGNRLTTAYVQADVRNGMLALLTTRDGIQIWDITNPSTPVLNTTLYRMTPSAFAVTSGTMSGFDVSYFVYKDVLMLCCGNNNNVYTYNQAVCHTFGDFPFPFKSKKTSFLTTRQARNIFQVTPTNTSSNSTTEQSSVSDLNPIKITIGTAFACALFESGNVRCWGRYDKGVLGYGTGQNLDIPNIKIVEFEEPLVAHKVIDLSSNLEHSCAIVYKPKMKAITSAYSLYCWGNGLLGRLGYGTEDNVGVPDIPRIKGPVKFNDAVPFQIVCGAFHTCAIVRNLTSNMTTARCWGDSSLGQLGYGVRSSVLAASAAEDIDLGGEPKKLALGSFHSCALFTNGRVKCWGTGTAGQTGRDERVLTDSLNNREPKTLPFLPTPSNQSVINICAGSVHTCIMLENRQVYCMGNNDRGQLGQSVNTTRVRSIGEPVKITTIPNEIVEDLTCGSTTTCVRFKSGAYHCWGENRNGVLGFRTPLPFLDSPATLPINRLNGTVEHLTAGPSQACGILSLGGQRSIRCWGQDPTSTSVLRLSSTAADIWPRNALKNQVIQIAAFQMSCALIKTGQIKCWGYGNGLQLGLFATTTAPGSNQDDVGVVLPASSASYVAQSILPSTVSAAQVVVGEWCGCAITSTGTAACWGYNELVGLITGWINNQTTPTNRIVSIALPRSPLGVCAMYTSGNVFCANSQISTRSDRSNLWLNITAITSISAKVVQMSIGEYFHCALTDIGRVACFGLNAGGQLGLGASLVDWVLPQNTDFINLGPLRAKKLASGRYHTCALMESGDVVCWGSSIFGQTGYGTIEDVGDDETPDQVGYVDIGPYPAIDVTCGATHTCIVVQTPEKNKVMCWGSNIRGQLGYPLQKGNVGDDETPASVGYLDLDESIVSIAGGFDHTCALTSTGTVKCWGSGKNGRLGYTGQEMIRNPKSVPDMSLTCGDGIKEYNEECDDGNFYTGDGCSKFCKIESNWNCRATTGTFSLCAQCGDYVVNLDETCDDGNSIAGDGCDNFCQVETGWNCDKVRGTLCEPIHGDGLVVGTEECDDGNLLNGCSKDGKIEPGFYCNNEAGAPSKCWVVCGDGNKASKEQCDDGNLDNGDGCSSTCYLESGWDCFVSCSSAVVCKSVCSQNSDDPKKVGLIVGLTVGLSLLIVLLLIVLFIFKNKKREILIHENDLTLIRKIGEGDFGEVYEAKWKSTTVALKQRKIEGISEEEIKMFSKEARVMQALPPHPNLVQFLGLCRTNEKLIIVCEYVEKGSVKRFLQEDCGKNTVTKRNQLELCLGICAGMDHLHSNGITHRDLACRNVLVEVKRSGSGFSLVPKISDFGLSVATSKQARLPVRWTAPEVLKNPRLRNKEADVWSFGVTMYEVFTRCSELPYLGKKNQEVVAFVMEGGHLKEPPQVDGVIRDVMLDCFKFKPAWRPSFITLSNRFEDIIKDMTQPTVTSNDTFSTVDAVETTSLQVFSDNEENDYMSMAKSDYTSNNLTSSNVKKGNTYEVVKSTDYESLRS